MNEENKKYIWSLLPEWVKDVPEGLDPMFYGTLTYEGDKKIHDKVNKILNNLDK